MKGGEIFYYDSAQDSGATRLPILALIHGLGDEADTWRHVFPALASEGFRVLAPDLPGFGRSAWKGHINLRVHAKAVIALLEKTLADNPNGAPEISLIGNSLGVGIAEMVACKRPDLAKRIILISSCFPIENRIIKKFWLLGLPFLGKKRYRDLRNNHKAAQKSLYPYYADFDGMENADKEFLRERVIERIESANQERGQISTVRSMNHFFLYGSRLVGRAIKKYPGKIYIIFGDKDIVYPLAKTALFRGMRKDAEFTLVTDAGHLPQQEKPEALVAQILRALRAGD